MCNEKVLDLKTIEKMIKNKEKFSKKQALMIFKYYRQGVILIRIIQAYQDDLWK